jgi:hypothetical protein
MERQGTLRVVGRIVWISGELSARVARELSTAAGKVLNRTQATCLQARGYSVRREGRGLDGQRRQRAQDGHQDSSVVGEQLMLQGIDNGKAWNMVIGSGTGRWGGSVVEDDGSFAILGSCTLP